MLNDTLLNFLLDNSIPVIFGCIGTLILSAIYSRRGVISYKVTHNQIGLSANDEVLGNVDVTFNGVKYDNLYVTNVFAENESFQDYESVKIKTYTGDTLLLSEDSRMVGSTQSIKYSKEFNELMHIKEGEQHTVEQRDLYTHQREYLIPVLNRKQKLHFSYITSTKNLQDGPLVWLEVIHKGVKIKYKEDKNLFWGVNRDLSSLIGLVICFFIVAGMLFYIQNIWTASILSFLIGSLCLYPGAFILKLIYWIRQKLQD